MIIVICEDLFFLFLFHLASSIVPPNFVIYFNSRATRCNNDYRMGKKLATLLIDGVLN